MALLNEETLYFITDKCQLISVKNLALDNALDVNEPAKFEYVHSEFHQQEITGMDVCLRKQLIVTCSKRAINIWNYATKTLEIQYTCQAGEEA